MRHAEQVLALLKTQIPSHEEVEDIRKTASKVAEKWVEPITGGSEETNGLVYGLVQSGKTGVLSVTGAIGADEGYDTIIIIIIWLTKQVCFPYCQVRQGADR